MVKRLLLLVALALPMRELRAHPLHSTITELTEVRAGVVRATIRVFADDFGTAVTRSLRGRTAPAGAAWDAAALAYISATFNVSDRSGRPLALRSCGIRRQADLYWVCVEASSATGLSSLAIANRVLCEVWADQVNVVQATIAGSRRSLLFTKGDGRKSVT